MKKPIPDQSEWRTLVAFVCPHCAAQGAYEAGTEPKPETCHQCGKPLSPAPTTPGGNQ